MSDKTYQYEVTAKTRGDYTEPSGPECVLYKGSSAAEALEVAQEAANDSEQFVRINVARKWTRKP